VNGPPEMEKAAGSEPTTQRASEVSAEQVTHSLSLRKTSAPAEINRLHSEICDAVRTSIENAIRIGELLTEQKAVLKHGEWLPWLKANVQFTARTASNYLRVFENRLRLKSETISDLTDAYNALTEHAESGQPANPSKWPRISIKHLGVFLRAFGPEDEEGYCTRPDWGAFDLLKIPIKEGHQAVDVYFDELDPPEHCARFCFHFALPHEAQRKVAS
jgi:Protein of unknown function (DUF3102)